jgi:N-acetylmuramoyl-L-alanine amidase
MRKINNIVLHCTATPQTTTIESIQRYWRDSLGWKSPGYHHIIKPNGEVVDLLPIEKPSNGVAGHNHDSIHISYIGGIDGHGKGLDNRTPAQKGAQIELLRKYHAMFPNAKILGHRDFPGVTKECPSFDVRKWLATVSID